MIKRKQGVIAVLVIIFLLFSGIFAMAAQQKIRIRVPGVT